MLACRRAVCALAFLASLATPAVAGPPFQTDDPEPTGYRQWEVYLFGDYTNGPSTAAGSVPALELNYGLMPNVQVSLTAPVGFARSAPGSEQFGYGDTQFGVKVRFVQESDGSPQVAFYPSVTIPTGQGALGQGALSTYLPLWVQKSWGRWTSYGGAGYLHPTGTGVRDSVFAGAVLLNRVSDGVTVGGELFTQTPQTVTSPAATSGFNVGLIAAAGANHALLFSIGRGGDRAPARGTLTLEFRLATGCGEDPREVHAASPPQGEGDAQREAGQLDRLRFEVGFGDVDADDRGQCQRRHAGDHVGLERRLAGPVRQEFDRRKRRHEEERAEKDRGAVEHQIEHVVCRTPKAGQQRKSRDADEDEQQRMHRHTAPVEVADRRGQDAVATHRVHAA